MQDNPQSGKIGSDARFLIFVLLHPTQLSRRIIKPSSACLGPSAVVLTLCGTGLIWCQNVPIAGAQRPLARRHFRPEPLTTPDRER